ncbi:MAG: GTPase ObgE [Candidatus Aminicenantia bacterium]
MFIDRVVIHLEGGKGGDGCVSFRREKYVPKGGPDGGDGGDGGNIYLISAEGVDSLVYFRFRPIIKAKRGEHGKGSNKHGKKGEDIYLKVPVGTVVKDKDKGEILFDFHSSSMVYLAATGGKGGRGNASFVSSTRRAPRIRELGKEGEKRTLILELKSVADVGIVGFPNAGKSTLLSKISSAKPLIADYPFTTLVPNLGVVSIDESRSFIMADIPGLIEGAHLGKGLGIRFLGHIERTKILLILLDVSSEDKSKILKDYEILINEISEFSKTLLNKPRIVVLNKIDLLEEDFLIEELKKEFEKMGLKTFAISALKSHGLKRLIKGIWDVIEIIKETKKIGVLGGTFDPIHLGHIRIGERVKEYFSLDKILFVPCFLPPHKESSFITPASVRFRMVEIALQEKDGFIPSAIEISREGTSFTIDTLRELKKIYKNSRLYLIIGVDAFSDIKTWKEWENIFKSFCIIILNRPNYKMEEAERLLQEMGFEYEKVSYFSKDKVNDKYPFIYFFEMDSLPISSREIRERVKKGFSIKGLVMPEVEKYIIENGLYKGEEK